METMSKRRVDAEERPGRCVGGDELDSSVADNILWNEMMASLLGGIAVLIGKELVGA
jgi:hypothetical protein